MSQNLFADLRDHVVAALAALLPDLPPEVVARVEVTPTRDPAHGDMATNAAMVAAKPAGQNSAACRFWRVPSPRDQASSICA
jgi:arginyl-tRNA synthetase